MLRTITTHTNRYRWDDDADGNPQEFPTELGTDTDVDTFVPDEVDAEDGVTAVDLVVRFFDRVNGVGASQWPGFRTGMWYSEADPYRHPYTGVVEERTFHLDGFTADEERAVWERVIS